MFGNFSKNKMKASNMALMSIDLFPFLCKQMTYNFFTQRKTNIVGSLILNLTLTLHTTFLDSCVFFDYIPN